MLDFRRAAVFFLGRRYSKHKMTRYAKNFGGEWLPGHAYVTRVAKNAKRASTRKYLRGLSKLCSSALTGG